MNMNALPGEQDCMASLQTRTPCRLYGWFDNPRQGDRQPTFEPSRSVPCPHCGKPMCDLDVRTHSFQDDHRRRSYFFRTHVSCDNGAPEWVRVDLYQAMLDRIRENRD